LTRRREREATSIDLVLGLRPAVETIATRYPGGIIQLVEDPPGPPVRATVLAEVYGPDLTVLDHLAQQVAGEFRQAWDMAEVWASVPYEVSEYRFRLRGDKAALAGLPRPRWTPPWGACWPARP